MGGATMLVLSRRLGESLVINDQLVLTVALLTDDYVELSLINVGGTFLGSFTARTNQPIRVTDDIQIVAVRIEGERVRLGIEGTPGSTFHRGEFWNLPS
jgi:sRNA-binding carbon storage regulator CsrA